MSEATGKFKYRDKVTVKKEGNFYFGQKATIVASEVKRYAMELPTQRYLVQINDDFEIREWYNEDQLEAT